jgi:hypothetical protein
MCANNPGFCKLTRFTTARETESCYVRPVSVCSQVTTLVATAATDSVGIPSRNFRRATYSPPLQRLQYLLLTEGIRHLIGCHRGYLWNEIFVSDENILKRLSETSRGSNRVDPQGFLRVPRGFGLNPLARQQSRASIALRDFYIDTQHLPHRHTQCIHSIHSG